MVRPQKDTVRRRREQLCLSQTDLAQKAGFSVRTLQRIEAGGLAKPETLRCISVVLNVPLPELLDDEDVTPTDLVFEPKLASAFAMTVCDHLNRASVDPGIIYDTAMGICQDLAGVLGKNAVFSYLLAAEIDDYLCPPCDADVEYLSDSDD